MSKFVCKKPITLSGHSFSYGEVIPDGLVLPERVLSLLRSNYITEFEDTGISTEGIAEVMTPIWPFQVSNNQTLIVIPISTEKGTMELTMNSENVVNVLTIMQKTVEEATKAIATMKDKDALILLDAVDSRVGIQKAAEKRAMQLSELPPEETGNMEEKLDKFEDDEKSGGESAGDI